MKTNRTWKWVLLAVFVGVSLLFIYPPSERLKPGIDLAGGTSLVYEIDMTGLEQSERSNLAERVMAILKSRVDPNQQFNLVWRPIGNSRLEIQMPRPPKEARERREAYEASRDKLRDLNVSRQELEQVLTLPAEQRQSALTALEHGVEGRAERLKAAADAWDAYMAVKGKGDIAQEVVKQQAYEASVEAVETTTLAVGRLTDILGLASKDRRSELDTLKKQYPAYSAAIDEVVGAYDSWSKKRGSLEDASDLKRLLRGAGVLEFRILAQRDPANPIMLRDENDVAYNEPVDQYIQQLNRRGPRPKAEDRYEWFEIDDFTKFMSADNLEQAKKRIDSAPVVVAPYAGRYYVLAYVDDGTSRYALAHGPKSKKWALKRAMPSRDFGTNRPCVDFQLDPRGGMQFAEMTKANINRQMAIFLDNVATSHATIISQIGERGQITGNFTQERVLEIVRKLEAGSLPARLKETPLQEKVVGPTLGARNRSMALKAAVIGFVAVVVYMVIYYTYLGVLADIALILNVLFLLAIMAAMEATFTLPGVAGVALTIGMAVDANVLINERIREELARGVSLKKAVQLGYDKAFAPIFDSNLTTLITSVILGYLGSEEVKGFALTLGFGVVISMFTSLFVTHLILDTLVERNLLKKLPMLHLIKDAKIDWMGLRKAFWTFSLITTVGGVAFFTWASTTDKEAVYDIELLGGSSVQIELADGVQMNAEQVLAAVTGKGKNADASQSGAAWLRRAADALKNAKIEPAPDAAGEYLVTAEGLDPADVNAMLLTTFERSLARNGFSAEGRTARFRTQALTAELDPNAPQGQPKDSAVDLDTFKRGVAEASEYIRAAANRLETAKVQSVAETGEDIKTSRAFEIVTVEPIKDVLRAAVLGTMGDKLKVDRRISFDVVTNAELAPDGMFPIREDANFLGEVIGTEAPVDIRSYKGGVVFIFDNLQPPQTIAGLERRFREMRLQPQFEQTESRETKLVGLQEAGKTASGEPLYSKVARLVSDESILYTDNPAQWEDKLARVELDQAREALTAERSLSKVVQFAPQMAKGTQQQALISMILAMIAIVIYVWVRFGTMQYGLAAVVAIFHDVGFTLGIATLATWLGLGDFKVDLSMIAAILTVIGYSVNDTIVVFDRIRENRGKLNVVTPAIINNSINGTLSRTILTGGTTLMTMFLMYFMGGPGVKTFCFVMLLGTIIGTYSSIGIAAPLLQSRRLLHTIVYCIMGGIAILTTYALSPTRGMLLAVSVMTIALICLLVVIERKADPDSDRSVVTA